MQVKLFSDFTGHHLITHTYCLPGWDFFLMWSYLKTKKVCTSANWLADEEHQVGSLTMIID